jgi:hypothetical protein
LLDVVADSFEQARDAAAHVTGRYANGNFGDYLVATNAGLPYIDVHFIGKPDTIFNPIGARGAGEIGVTGIPAAIANAVYNATGQRVLDFPITLDKLILPTHGLAISTADDSVSMKEFSAGYVRAELVS